MLASSVIIDDLNIVGIAITPREADEPLVVDAYAVGSGTIAPEQFQLVARRYAEVLQSPCLLEVQEFSARRAFDRLKRTYHAVLKQRCGVCAFERTNQVVGDYAYGVMSSVIDGALEAG